MKLELNVVRMANEDVIATSCKNAPLFECNTEDETTLIKYVGSDMYDVTSDYASKLPTKGGFYHYENGKFVECPTWNKHYGEDDPIEENWEDCFEAHNIVIDD